MRRIVIASLKGGTGKSTTATTVAVGMAQRGQRVLVIDADSQSNSTWTLLGGRTVGPPTLADVLTRSATVDEAVLPTSVQGLDLIPASSDLSGVNVALVQELGRDTRLRAAMSRAGDRWDVVIVDTAPTVTTVLANALVFADEVITTVDLGMYSILGLTQIQGIIDEVREAYGNHELHLAGMVLTRVQKTKVHAEVESSLRERFKERIYRSTIPLTSKIEEACQCGETVLTFAPKSPGAVAYSDLVTEIVEHVRTKTKSTRRRSRKDNAA